MSKEREILTAGVMVFCPSASSMFSNCLLACLTVYLSNTMMNNKEKRIKDPSKEEASIFSLVSSNNNSSG